MTRTIPYLSVALLFAASTPAAAQQATIPVRTVSGVVATDSGRFRSITSVRPLSDGRVLVNDATNRRLIIVDSSLAHHQIIADTAAGARNKYGGRPGNIIPYNGDSSVFVDMDAQALIVISPEGAFGRVMALPSARDLIRLGLPTASAAFDPKGRLVYRGYKPPPRESNPGINSFQGDEGKIITGVSFADSAPIVRADFETRAVDTIAMMRLPNQKITMFSPARGMSCGALAFNPLPTTDEWTLLPDGTIALVRSQDYHIDWWPVDGKMTATPKMPFDWKRITLEEREALLDSVKAADAARRAAAPPPPPSPSGVIVCRPPFVTVGAEDMADYYPPIRAGQVRADPQGNVWVLPSTSSLSTPTNVGLVWDIVNRKGEVIERVKLPEGRNLAGFGPNGTVYMIYAPTPQKIFLERGSIVR